MYMTQYSFILEKSKQRCEEEINILSSKVDMKYFFIFLLR